MTFLYKKIYALNERPSVAKILDWILPYRLWIVVGIHLFLFALSYACAFLLLKEQMTDADPGFLFGQTAFLLVTLRFVSFWRYDLYRGLWRYVSFQDLLNILRATLISSAVFVAVGIVWKPLRVLEGVYVLDGILCIVLAGGARCFVRNIRENIYLGFHQKEMHNILVVGPLANAQPLVKELIDDPYSRYNPVAIVDPTKDGNAGATRVQDVPVLSLKQILLRSNRLHRRNGFPRLEAVTLSWPDATRKELDTLIEALKPIEVPFKTVPPIEDILAGRIKISEIRDLEIENLLERPAIHIQTDRIRSQLQGKVILVTGGAGSIGSELCRQVAGFNPRLLVVVERSENSLYDFKLEFKSRFPDVPLYASISSINDYQGMLMLMKKMAVDVVFHAAAYKHVPLMEDAPVESAYNNILGTHNLARASLEAGVERFVMISTDKAVNPTNVMGVTKRIAEMAVQSYNGDVSTKFMVVRFGNVLGSAGSVIPIFRKQIVEGRPITITHPDIERFFMTIPEAVQLVLQAGSMGNGGEIFVLDMGKPVKILHLAEKLITLLGKRPYRDVEIVYTGLRPGEKMYEELFDECETRIQTSHEQIMVAVSPHEDRDFVKRQIVEIREMVLLHDEEALRKKFKEIVPAYCAPPGMTSTNNLLQSLIKAADSLKVPVQPVPVVRQIPEVRGEWSEGVVS